MAGQAVSIAGLSHGYGSRTLFAVESLSLGEGESLAITGPSGCGKTTLLHLIAGLMAPRTGAIAVLNQEMSVLGEAARDRFRGQNIGILFQRHHLIPAITLAQNLALAMTLAGNTVDAARIDDLLRSLDLGARAHDKPATLSGGETLRACLARALVNRPRLLLADEPTSSLDDTNAVAAISLLQREASASGAALIVATHDARVRAAFPRHYEMAAQAGGRP